MPKASPNYCRNAEDIARALGLKVPSRKQRNKFAAFLKQLNGWTRNEGLPAGAPPFPVKQKNGYWLVKEVVAWGEAGKQKAESRKQKGASRTGDDHQPSTINSQPVLAARDDAPGEEGDLFARLTPEQVAAANRERLQRNLKIHLGLVAAVAPLRKFEVDELVANGLLPRTESMEESGEDVGGSATNISGGTRGVANWIRNNHPGLAPSHTTIQRWIKGEELPAGCTENFPGPEAGGSGRFKTAEVRAWVDRYLVKRESSPGLGLPVDWRSRKDKADALVAEMEAEAMARRLSKDWALKADVYALIDGTDAMIEQRYTNALEQELPGTLLKLVLARVTLDEATTQLLRTEFSAAAMAVNASLKNGFAQEEKQLKGAIVEMPAVGDGAT